MSEILVNEIKHRNGTSAIAINTSAQMTVRSEGGNATTNLQLGLAKVWHHYNQSGTLATVNSFNVSSATDNSVGVTTTVYINVLANDKYTVSGSHNSPSGNTASWVTGYDNSSNFKTGQVTCSTFNVTSGRIDASRAMMSIQGDLA